MGNTLTDARREEIWEILSDAFVDGGFSYEHMASLVADVAPALLKEIFFTEVAPFCAPNMLATAPPVWGGFNREKLVEGIRAELSLAEKSLLGKLRYAGIVAFCRWYFRADWKEISSRLPEGKQA